jgi:hypothetical protein
MKGTALLVAFGRPAEMTPQQKLGCGYLAGMMPLHIAAIEGIVKLLISRGADLNVRVTSGPHKGKIPLDGFVGSNDGKHTEITAYLRKHGGKIWQELKAERAK